MYIYPRFNVVTEVTLDISLLEWPQRRDADHDSALGCNQEYIDLRGLSWAQARRVFALETDLIRRLEVASDTDAEYDLIEEELFRSAENLFGLDIGVASVVACLSAANCIPFTSCNAGTFGGSHQEDHPLVAFFARSSMASRLVAHATTVQVGLANGLRGCAVLYTDDIRKFTLFALMLLGGAVQRTGPKA
jgi:hypothetical protein